MRHGKPPNCEHVIGRTPYDIAKFPDPPLKNCFYTVKELQEMCGSFLRLTQALDVFRETLANDLALPSKLYSPKEQVLQHETAYPLRSGDFRQYPSRRLDHLRGEATRQVADCRVIKARQAFTIPIVDFWRAIPLRGGSIYLCGLPCQGYNPKSQVKLCRGNSWQPGGVNSLKEPRGAQIRSDFRGESHFGADDRYCRRRGGDGP